MNLVVLIIAAAIAGAVSFAVTPLTAALAHRVGAVDRPGARKVHGTPVPRLGGLAVIGGIAVAVLVGSLAAPWSAGFMQMTSFWITVGAGLLPVLVVSVLDDIRSVRAALKLLAHVGGAAVVVSLGVKLGPAVHLFGAEIWIGWVAAPLSVFWIVAVTNAFNLVDGLDGLSAGLAFISAISLGIVSVVVHMPAMAIASFIVAAALAGFLPFNIHPARVFLGDTGATACGFVLATLALAGGSTLSAGLAIVVPVLVLGLPIADTVVTVARRALRGRRHKMFEPDREHFHHRLMSLGLEHKQAVYVLYGVGLLLAGGGIASLFMTYTKSAVLLISLLVATFVGVHKLGYDEFAFVRRGPTPNAYEVPVLRSTLFAAFIDVVLIVAALYAAFVLKYDDWLVESHRLMATQLLAVSVALVIPALAALQVYRRSWRLATPSDLMRAVSGTLIGTSLTYALAVLFFEHRPSLSLVVIFTILLVALIGGSRASYRIAYDVSRSETAEGEPVVIYGAGRSGAMALRKLVTSPDLNIRPVGFVDDDPALHGRIVQGLPVLGSVRNMPGIIGSVTGVLIASDRLAPERVAQVRELCEQSGRWMRFFHTHVISSDVPAPRVQPEPSVPAAVPEEKVEAFARR